MRYVVLALDYDGTLAKDGLVPPEAIAGLKRVIDSGRKLILVTGRQLGELMALFPDIGLFERVVAENGAVIYHPATRETRVLAERPAESFIDALKARDVSPLSVGEVIVASYEPHETAILDTIRNQALELQVIFNKRSIMVLPSGVNKATGLAAALQELRLSPRNVVGVGDAENDQAFLNICGCSAAVGNALPSLKRQVDWVLKGSHWRGVLQLTQKLIDDDLSFLDARVTRRQARNP